MMPTGKYKFVTGANVTDEFPHGDLDRISYEVDSSFDSRLRGQPVADTMEKVFSLARGNVISKMSNWNENGLIDNRTRPDKTTFSKTVTAYQVNAIADRFSAMCSAGEFCTTSNVNPVKCKSSYDKWNFKNDFGISIPESDFAFSNERRPRRFETVNNRILSALLDDSSQVRHLYFDGISNSGYDVCFYNPWTRPGQPQYENHYLLRPDGIDEEYESGPFQGLERGVYWRADKQVQYMRWTLAPGGIESLVLECADKMADSAIALFQLNVHRYGRDVYANVPIWYPIEMRKSESGSFSLKSNDLNVFVYEYQRICNVAGVSIPQRATREFPYDEYSVEFDKVDFLITLNEKMNKTMKHLILLSLFALHFSLFTLSASAAVPLRWTVETSRLAPAVFDVVRGETIALEAAFNSSGKPFSIDGEPVSIFWQTNGMGIAWWTAPAIATSNLVRATFTPEMDPGAATVNGFLGSSGSIYRAAFTFRFRHGPGAVPNTLPLPVPVIDFAKVRVLNPPWSGGGGGGGVDTNAVIDIVHATVDGECRYLPPYLHYKEMDDTYPKAAAEWYAQADYSHGSCSARRTGNLLERNYDWNFDFMPEFVVRCVATASSPSCPGGRFASIAVCNVGTNLTEADVVSGKHLRWLKALPGHAVDGINSEGVVAEVNVVSTNGVENWHGDPAADGIHCLGAIRWVLDHATNAQHGAEVLAAKVYVPAGYGNFHYMIADATSTWIVENGEAHLVPSSLLDGAVLTNFRLYPTRDTTGEGQERYDALASGENITNAWYTNAYRRETNPPWVSDLIDVLDYTNEIFDAWAAHPKEYFRGKTNNGIPWWQTVHTSIYDISNRTLRVAVQEVDDWYTFQVPSAGGVKPEAVREIVEPMIGAATNGIPEQIAALQSGKRGVEDLDVYEDVELITISDGESDLQHSAFEHGIVCTRTESGFALSSYVFPSASDAALTWRVLEPSYYEIQGKVWWTGYRSDGGPTVDFFYDISNVKIPSGDHLAKESQLAEKANASDVVPKTGGTFGGVEGTSVEVKIQGDDGTGLDGGAKLFVVATADAELKVEAGWSGFASLSVSGPNGESSIKKDGKEVATEEQVAAKQDALPYPTNAIPTDAISGLVQKIHDEAPAPGDYAAVSNAAMNAIQAVTNADANLIYTITSDGEEPRFYFTPVGVINAED